MTLSDLERRDVRGQNIPADLVNNARIVCPRTTKFGRITLVGEKRISRGQTRPYRKGAGPQHSPFCCSFLFLCTPFVTELPNLT